MLIDGDIDLDNVAELRLAFASLDKQDPVTSLVVDIQGVTRIDASAFGALMVAEKKITAGGGKFALANASEKIKQILVQSKMDEYFTLYENDNFT